MNRKKKVSDPLLSRPSGYVGSRFIIHIETYFDRSNLCSRALEGRLRIKARTVLHRIIIIRG